ncbi:hypothetical protein KY359_01450 [Candidatus Woesearchaeota archaeon]|nr:hypothetical protein [Candidatus Woesearchaeota archaeon]
MVAVRDISADFAEIKAEMPLDRPGGSNPLYGPLLYCAGLEYVRSQREEFGSDFRIKPYWSGNTLRDQFERHETDVNAHNAHLDFMVESMERCMSNIYVREYGPGDFVLLKMGPHIRVGRECGDGHMFMAHDAHRKNGFLLAEKVICRLRPVMGAYQGMPAVVMKENMWTAGFPFFQPDWLLVTSDREGNHVIHAYNDPCEVLGLVPMMREEPFLQGPYR